MEFGRNNLHATLGVTAVLHTWGQNLLDHYHLHCVVTGGGLSLDGQNWVPLGRKWLFPVRALSLVFRAKFRDGLLQLFRDGKLQFPGEDSSMDFPRWLRRLCRHQWVVYCKRPFAGPRAVLAYLCRYTHRVAITNSRLEGLDEAERTVTFRYKDYAHDGQHKRMQLPTEEFLRRFCLHILPPRFVKIRHFGILANRTRLARIAQARALLIRHPSETREANEADLALKHVAPHPLRCPFCGCDALVLVRAFNRPKSPSTWDTS